MELPFLKCNENAAFLFKNTYSKEKSPFLFESPKFRTGQYLFLFHIRLYLKISLICSKFLKGKRTLLLLKSGSDKGLKTKYQQRGAKLKVSIGKKDILYRRKFSATFPNKLLLLKIFTYFQ